MSEILAKVRVVEIDGEVWVCDRREPVKANVAAVEAVTGIEHLYHRILSLFDLAPDGRPFAALIEGRALETADLPEVLTR